ncbi:unnamed protein product [Pleuronectes platessa]|uniref:Uncharacterized protein n=1 Tax=Pleuronectes platessa TaxID=8262 RepID=A0A9N7YK77_PLEPL|nr:unnamed protein product [Pleuronectes platessa]
MYLYTAQGRKLLQNLVMEGLMVWHFLPDGVKRHWLGSMGSFMMLSTLQEPCASELGSTCPDGREGDFSSLTGGSLGGNRRSLSALYLSVHCASILPPSDSPCRLETINVSVAQRNVYCVNPGLTRFMHSASPS